MTVKAVFDFLVELGVNPVEAELPYTQWMCD